MAKFKLGTREIVAIILIIIGTKFTDATPDLLFPHTFMATWMVPLISAGMIIAPFLLLLKLFNKYELGLVDLVKNLSGKWVGSFLCICLFLISLVGTGILLSNYAHILSALYFPQTPVIVLYIFFTFVCCLIAYGGAYMVGRTAWIVLPYIKLALVLLLILSIKKGLNTSFLFPLFGKGFDVVIRESFLHNSIYIDCMLIATLIPFMKQVKDFSKAAIIGLCIVAVEMSIFFLFYIMIFDAYTLANLSLPFQHLTRMVELGRFLTNFEGYFLAFWIVGSIVKYATYLFVTTLLFTQTFNIKSTKYFVFPITLLVLFIGFIPENIIKSSFFYREVLLYIASVFFVGLPILLWILSFWKKASVTS